MPGPALTPVVPESWWCPQHLPLSRSPVQTGLLAHLRRCHAVVRAEPARKVGLAGKAAAVGDFGDAVAAQGSLAQFYGSTLQAAYENQLGHAVSLGLQHPVQVPQGDA